jgi:transforming growth factor-beta-induced protein
MQSRWKTALVAGAALLVAPAAGMAGTSKHHGGSRPPAPTIAELATQTPELSILVQAAEKAGLVDELNDRSARLTVFAPTNEAFAALLADLGLTSLDQVPPETAEAILLDHVVAKKLSSKRLARFDRRDVEPKALGGLSIDFDRSPAGVNDAGVVAADIKAANGYVHVIDKVLVDPDPRPTIAQLAIGTPELSTLVQAVTRAGLVDAISDPAADLTVFAPTNDAFAALLARLGFASLEEVPVETLRGILLDHVVGKELDAVDLRERACWWGRTPTLGGLHLRFSADGTKVNRASIVAGDVEGVNGTVHVIDAVLTR